MSRTLVFRSTVLNPAYRTSAKEVSQILTCISSTKLTVSARSGGHSYAGYGLAGDVVVDLSKMKGFNLSADGMLVAQTGNLLGDIAQNLWDKGQRALPHGTCPVSPL